jgi:hypothetical protein
MSSELFKTSKDVLNAKLVIVKSIDHVKKMIQKLDLERGEIQGGIDLVLSQFSPNDMMNFPEKLLDKLILYLFCVHRIDFYNDNWNVVAPNAAISVRPSPGLRVFGESGEEAEILSYLERLEYRTDKFIQVFY